ncbi:MAG: hypothetical protein B6245_06250 [Desulfobacteraceae bacterium 4572_88]|nr:MAG: hypothetical protein B6245_06250 [Desulfobacteraceae bacterium 4572_88]
MWNDFANRSAAKWFELANEGCQKIPPNLYIFFTRHEFHYPRKVALQYKTTYHIYLILSLCACDLDSKSTNVWKN